MKLLKELFRLFRRPRRGALLWLCCLQFLSASTLWAADDRGLFYRVGNVYLLGSVHMGKADFYPLRATITDAFNASDTLVVEVDVGAIEPVQLGNWITAHGTYPAGESLRDHLQPATWKRLETYLKNHHIDPALIAGQKPGLAITTLSVLQMQSIGFSSDLGIDGYFLQQARTRHKAIVELESLEQQLTLLSELPNADLLVNQTLDEADALPELMDGLIAAWKAGDAARLEQLLLRDSLREHPEYRPLFEQLYTRRNHAMTARIKTMLQSRQRCFVVVGAAHLLGSDGIVELLKKAGQRVEQQ